MAADPFNSKAGYTIGIPPRPFLDLNGNLTVNAATVGNVLVTGDQVVNGNISATTFIGTFQGNISGNLVVPGQNTWVLFNNQGNAGASEFLRFDSAEKILTVEGTIVADSLNLQANGAEVVKTSVVFATTASTAPDQVLHRIPATEVCSVDYTIIATNADSNIRQTTKLFSSNLGTEVGYYEYGTIDVPQSSPGVGDFQVRYNTGNVELTVEPYSASLVNYKIMVTSYKE